MRGGGGGVKKFQLIGKFVQCKNQVAQITRAYTIMWLFVIVYKHEEIYTKTISRPRLGDYKPISTSPFALCFNSPLATKCQKDTRVRLCYLVPLRLSFFAS